MERKNEMTELIVRDVFEESPGELSSRNPMVLSCGGIYIPHRRNSVIDKPLWHVINIADENSSSKVVCSGLPKSPLAQLLEKESMN